MRRAKLAREPVLKRQPQRAKDEQQREGEGDAGQLHARSASTARASEKMQ